MTRLASFTPVLASAMLISSALALSCNNVPIENLEDSFTLTVRHSTGSGKAVAIDFLWMVDNSTSMCEEQFALAGNFDTFSAKLTNFFAIDPRVAVTTADMQCPIQPAQGINASGGVFNTVPATRFPTACIAKHQTECSTNEDCTPVGDSGTWSCNQENLPVCIVNPNGSVNTSCQRGCQTDDDCQSYYGNDYICLTPGDSPESWGCVRPPQTASCPSTLPPYITADNLEQFSCLATVGVYAENCFKYEQGLRSAMAAIDPGGPNAAQAAGFLRDDAYLVVILVSDEDDCSTPDGVSFTEDFYYNCALQPTTDAQCPPIDPDTGLAMEGSCDCQGGRGKLVPVTNYINRLKALKADPSRVIVATISGDAVLDDAGTPDDPSDDTVPADGAPGCLTQPGGEAALVGELAAECVRREFFESKGAKRACHQKSYVCSSASGVADYGSRYKGLADGFGFNGLFSNICAAEGIGPALDAIADKIIQVVDRVCLPKPITEDDLGTLSVVRVAGGTSTTLTESDNPNDDQYKFYPSDANCHGGEPGELLPAITFGRPTDPQEVITITYKGDPRLGQ
jgi:hypothetical protein